MWKTFAGQCIYQDQNRAKVYQNYLYRWLTLGSEAIQTLINRKHPEKPELGYIYPLAFAVQAQPADCCLLGLGGAGVAHTLAPYLQNLRLVAVEKNSEIIEVSTNLAIIHQDANLFVQQCETHYQHLMVDLFDAHEFPAHCNTHDFFANCKRLLLQDVILSINLANLDEKWPVFQHVRDIFSQRTVSLPIKGASNMVILACNSPSVAPLLDLLTNSHCLKKLSWDARWGCVAELG